MTVSGQRDTDHRPQEPWRLSYRPRHALLSFEPRRSAARPTEKNIALFCLSSFFWTRVLAYILTSGTRVAPNRRNSGGGNRVVQNRGELHVTTKSTTRIPNMRGRCKKTPKAFNYVVSDRLPSTCDARSSAVYHATVFLIALSSIYGGTKPILRIFVA